MIMRWEDEDEEGEGDCCYMLLAVLEFIKAMEWSKGRVVALMIHVEGEVLVICFSCFLDEDNKWCIGLKVCMLYIYVSFFISFFSLFLWVLINKACKVEKLCWHDVFL